MRKSIYRSALAAGLLCSAAAHGAVFMNGSFESSAVNPGGFVTLGLGSTAMTGWTVTLGSVDYIGTYWTAADGARSVDLAGGGSPSTISQTFDTVAGQAYTVSFAMAGNPDGPPPTKQVTVGVDGYSGSFTFLNSAATTKPAMGWQSHSFTFVANDANATLSFTSSGQTSAYGAAIDNIAVTPVPEASEWAMMAAGLGMIGLIASRRRRASAG